MENNTFKGTLFGGFKREDVIDYIAKTSAASGERIAALEADVDKLLAQEKELRAHLAAVEAEKAALAASDNKSAVRNSASPRAAKISGIDIASAAALVADA